MCLRKSVCVLCLCADRRGVGGAGGELLVEHDTAARETRPQKREQQCAYSRQKKQKHLAYTCIYIYIYVCVWSYVCKPFNNRST